jgi:hypothetical protein
VQQLSRWAAVAALALAATPTSAQQDWRLTAASARVTHFGQEGRGVQSQADPEVDGDGVPRGSERLDVAQPAMRLEVQQSHRARHVVDLLVDVVSSASADALDAISTASLWNEAVTLGIESQVDVTEDDHLQVRYGMHLEEPLKGGFGGLGYRRDFAQDNATLDVRFALQIDAFDPLTIQGADLGFVRRRTILGSAAFTQLLSPTTIASASYGVTHQWGVLEQTWNSVPIAGSTRRIGERFPGRRTRHALTAGIKHHFARTRSTIDLRYRFYADDFGLRAHSGTLRAAQWLHRMMFVRVGYRLHQQNGVDFWTSGTPPPREILNQPRTSDSDLARFVAHEWTAKLVVFTRRELGLQESFSLSVGRYWRPHLSVTITAAGYERRF